MPYKSQAQAGLFHSPNSPVSPEKVAEFDRASKGKHLPKRVGKPAALAKGGKLVDHGDHFKLHTAGGDVYTMAKNGLSPHTVKHFQSFAEGGKVSADDEQEYRGGGGPGNEVVTPETQTPEQGAAAAEEAARGEGAPGSGETETNDREKEIERFNRSDFLGVDQPGQEARGDTSHVPGSDNSSVISTADTSNKLPVGGEPEKPVVTSDNVQLGKFQAAKVHDMTQKELDAGEAAKAARSADAAEQDRIAGKAGEAEDAKVKELDSIAKLSDSHLAEIEGRRKQLQTDIANGKIDPNHYWAEKGTGGRIMASIGLLLSGIGAGLGNQPNMAMQVIQANIKRDIDAQEKNLDTKKSLLADTYRETGDLRLARQVAEHHAMVVAQAQLNKLAAQSSSSAVKMRAGVANAAVDMAIGQAERGIADRRSANQVAAANANVQAQNALALQKAKAGDALKTPREMQGAKVASMNSSIVKLQDHLSNLEKGWQGPIAGRLAESFPWGGADTKANAAAADLLRESIASSFGGGVASDARIQAAKASVPGPEDTPAVAKEKIRRLEHTLNVMRDEYLATQGGVGYKTAGQQPVTPPPAPTRR